MVEIFHHGWEVLSLCFDKILVFFDWCTPIISSIGNICVFIITIYTFILTVYPKRLRFIDFSQTISLFNGDSAKITLENRSLSPVVVKRVSLVLGNSYMEVFKGTDSQNAIIEGFKTNTFVCEPFSALYNEKGEFSFRDSNNFKNLAVIVETTRGIQYVEFQRISEKKFSKQQKVYDERERLSVCRDTFNGKLLPQNTAYVLVYFSNDELQTVFILENGALSSPLFGYNALSKDIMKSKEDLQKYLDNEFGKGNIRYKLIDERKKLNVQADANK